MEHLSGVLFAKCDFIDTSYKDYKAKRKPETQVEISVIVFLMRDVTTLAEGSELT